MARGAISGLFIPQPRPAMEKPTTPSERLLDLLMIAIMAGICFLLMSWK